MLWSSFDSYMDKMKRIFSEIYRVIKYGRCICVNISDYNYRGYRYPLTARFTVMLESIGFNYVATIYWKKPEGLGANKGGVISARAGNFVKTRNPLYFFPDDITESIIVMRKGKIDYSKLPPSIKNFKYSDDVMKRLKKYLINIWEFSPKNQKHRYHRSEYPVILPKTCIELFTIPGDVVIDCFAGSGTTGVAAKMTSRSSIQIEINKKYIPIIKKRLGWGEKKIGKRIIYKFYKFD